MQFVEMLLALICCASEIAVDVKYCNVVAAAWARCKAVVETGWCLSVDLMIALCCRKDTGGLLYMQQHPPSDATCTLLVQNVTTSLQSVTCQKQSQHNQVV